MNFLSGLMSKKTIGQRKRNESIATLYKLNESTNIIEFKEVKPASMGLPEIPYKNAVESLLVKPPSFWGEEDDEEDTIELTKPVEACSKGDGTLLSKVYYHPLLATIHLAYQDHRPLILSPDMFWLAINQGFANHINQNTEKFRSNLVEHKGKCRISIRRDDFIKGEPTNPWPEVFDEIVGQIQHHIGDKTFNLLKPDFSTTGTIERTVSQIVLMDTLKPFFSYELTTLCGIPQITLKGTLRDWQSLLDKAQMLAQYDLSWWIDALIPILSEIISTSKGNLNTQFWKSIYKFNDESGGPYVTGWISAFFPYLKNYESQKINKKNSWLIEEENKKEEVLCPPEEEDDFESFSPGPTLEEIPGGLSKVPFIWNYLNETFDMLFIGGFVGVYQDSETLSLKPEIGWAISEA